MSDRIILSTSLVPVGTDYYRLTAKLDDGTTTTLSHYRQDELVHWRLLAIDFDGASLKWAEEEVNFAYDRDSGVPYRGDNPYPRTF